MFGPINKDVYALIVFGLLAYFPIFLHLDGYPAFNWDESMYGLRMLYLAGEGYPLPGFSHFEGVKPILNYKPPLFTAVQAFFLRLLGYEHLELSLRLPVGLSVVGTLLILLGFSRKMTRDYVLGIMAGLILLSSGGFMAFHVARTGDHDAPLALFSLGAFVSFFLYDQSAKTSGRKLWLYLLVACLVMGFLTKTIGAFFFLPGFLGFLLVKAQLPAYLRRTEIWLAALVLLGTIALYYGLMDLLIPDFVGREKGQLDRFQRTIDGHAREWSFYATRLFRKSFWPWVLLLPLGAWAGFRERRSWKGDLALLTLLTVFFHYLVISLSATKLFWYEAPSMPLLALLAALGLKEIWDWTGRKLAHWPTIGRHGLRMAALALVIAGPYWQTTRSFYHFLNWDPTEHFGLMIRKTQDEPEFRELTSYATFNTPHIALYKAAYNKLGRTISLAHRLEELEPGMLVVVTEPHRIDSLEAAFQTRLLRQENAARLYRIESRK